MNKYYRILGVNENSTKEEIKRAHRNLLKKYHPDTYPGDKKFASKKSAEINEAYAQVLADREEKGYKETPNPEKKPEPQVRKENSNRNKERKPFAKQEKVRSEQEYVKTDIEAQEKIVANKLKRELSQKEKKTKRLLDISIIILSVLTITMILLITLL